MKKQNIQKLFGVFVLILAVFVSTEINAQEETENTTEQESAKQEDMRRRIFPLPVKDRIIEKKEMIDTKREEVRENMEIKKTELTERTETKREEVKEKIKERRESMASNIISRLENVITRFEKHLEFIESRIVKLENESYDVTEARNYLSESKKLIEQSKTSISDARLVLSNYQNEEGEDATGNEISAEAKKNRLEEFKSSIKKVTQSIKDIQLSITNTLRALKEINSNQEDIETEEVGTVDE